MVVDTKWPVVTAAVGTGDTLRLAAKDTGSGLAQVQLATRRSHPAKAQRYRSALRTRSANWVRVIDRAGNRSAWRRIAR